MALMTIDLSASLAELPMQERDSLLLYASNIDSTDEQGVSASAVRAQTFSVFDLLE